MELQDDIIDFDLIDIDSVDEQPSILARETINNSEDQSITTLLVCPECGELLELKLINVKEIECKCKCGYFEIISINDFFIHGWPPSEADVPSGIPRQRLDIPGL